MWWLRVRCVREEKPGDKGPRQETALRKIREPRQLEAV